MSSLSHHRSPLSERIAGRDTVFDLLFARFYPELREIARLHLRRERPGHTLQTTALVHEAYLKLNRRHAGEWEEPVHFRAFVSRAMRHILIDHARGRATDKRGGDAIHITLLPDAGTTDSTPTIDLLDLDRALTRLSELDERLVRVVECRFFGDLTVRETAQALGISPRTVERDWLRAQTYLLRLLRPLAVTPTG